RGRLGRRLTDMAEVERHLDGVEYCCESGLRRGRLRELLGDAPDIERLMSRIVAGSALPRELLGLRRGLEAAPALRLALGAAAPGKHARGERSDESEVGSQTSDDGDVRVGTQRS